jgi:hypothetical protein
MRFRPLARLALIAAVLLAIQLWLDQTHVKPLYFLWYLAFGALAVGALALLLNRFHLALVLAMAPLAGLIALDRMKAAVLQDHLRWIDLAFLAEAFDGWSTAAAFMIDYVDRPTALALGAATAAIALLVALLARLERPLLAPAARGWRRPASRRALGLAGLALLPLAMALTATPVLELKGRALFWPQAHYRYGTLLFFLGSRRDLATRPDEIALPAESEARILAAAATPAAGPRPVAAPALSERRPDIVLWINESTFDLRDLAASEGLGRKVRPHRLAMFEPRPETMAAGPLAVSVYGGNSWTTEFALQAGARSEWFGIHASYTTVALAPYVRTTLFKELRAAGYRTVVLYGFEGDYFGEAQAYRHYGVEEFQDPADLSPAPLEDRLAVLGDQALADAVLARLAAPGGQPLCILVFTMANHGPYGAQSRRRADFKATEAIRAFWGDGLSDALYDYLDRLRETDRVMAGLADALMARPEPTVLLHLGDHKPSLPGVAFAEAVKYQSYYHLLSNRAAGPVVWRPRDVLFLPGLVLAAAGAAPGPLFAANAWLGERCAGPFSACLARDRPLAQSYQTLAMTNLDFRRPGAAAAAPGRR